MLPAPANMVNPKKIGFMLVSNFCISPVFQDTEGNKIQQWKQVQTEMGLTQMSLPLSDRPPLGDWTIKVSTQVEYCCYYY